MEPNKRVRLTNLWPALERPAEVAPCAPAGKKHGGTASQLIGWVTPAAKGTSYSVSVTGNSAASLWGQGADPTLVLLAR